MTAIADLALFMMTMASMMSTPSMPTTSSPTSEERAAPRADTSRPTPASAAASRSETRIPTAMGVRTDAATQTPSPLDDGMLDAYFAEMQRRGLLDNREATLEQVEERLRHAQRKYVQGDALGSAIDLFEIDANPRYENFRALPIMSAVDYQLGVSLQAHGADRSAAAAFARVLARGPSEPFFTPALRRHVDIALASKDYVRGLAELDEHLQRADGSVAQLTNVDLDEHEYLEARALHQQGRTGEALAKYVTIGHTSRFYTASRYLQGVLHAENRDFRQAEAAFCSVVEAGENSVAGYYVDRRYFPVRDLAQLGLGRVAHEELRHGHAFYHYFQIPQDSNELAAALFESAWTMAEEGEYAVARGLITDLQQSFPNSPQAVEARVLAAMLELYDCDFRVAEKHFAEFIDDVAPVADRIRELRSDPERLRALHEELVESRHAQSRGGDLPAHRLLLAMLDEDPVYARLSQRADVLRHEAEFASALIQELSRVRDQLQGRDAAVAGTPGETALSVIHDAHALTRALAGIERQLREAEAAGADPKRLTTERIALVALRQRVRALETTGVHAVVQLPPVGSAMTTDLAALVQRDIARVGLLRSQALALAIDVDERAAMVAGTRLGRLEQRIESLMGEARMGRIDAVLGAKKKLEIEVRDMAAGKFPPELFGKLEIEGVIGDDEEYWPYEGEYWADEYEGYR